MNHYLEQQLALHDITAAIEQQQQLLTYIDLLQKWNSVYNLIGNAEPKHIIDRHIIDSLLVLPYLQGKNVIDVGTGAGLPGIPLAIMLPNHQFTLLDSNGKKTRFVTQAKLTLKLSNLTVVNKRVEEYQPEILFDVVISRAFASLAEMIHLTEHLCAPQGNFMALKGDGVEKEMAELPEHFKCKTVQRLPFADKQINRTVVVVERN